MNGAHVRPPVLVESRPGAGGVRDRHMVAKIVKERLRKHGSVIQIHAQVSVPSIPLNHL